VLGRDLPQRVGDRAARERRIEAGERRRHAARVKADGRFTAADARSKLRQLYPTLDA
jgi:hypothetical protein